MRIGELAQKSGLSADTLRYYEKIGLIPRPLRDGGGRRVYDAAVLRWIEFLDRLKATGMGIRDRLRYAHLRSKGNSSLTERRKLLEVHRVKVAGDLARLAETLDVLDEKIDLYRRMEAGEPVDPALESCARTEHGVPPSSGSPIHEYSTGARTRPDTEA
ncbi:MerR family transcriptional regulator [Roseibium salinum]|uniref:MerR family transcriptional regulator n=1 Tax=Roseibium salinum TaxID=1604349 RepID=A0ABT3QXV7_9HYPH|nr:MerR family transcriptional regulator [Roseibium sp. DSM 29163]MCX2721681.1 MerR family transcriptional regulator [Roseibium sp. DSM 29163]